MGCAGEPTALRDEATAERAATLANAAESSGEGGPAPVYIIGTEVPVPGGAQHALDSLEVTRPEAALRTVDVHRKAFSNAGLEAAFARAVGVVVQPGVEFGSTEVIAYNPGQAKRLTGALSDLPGFVFEAHSTDYQPAACLDALVRDGFAILKVGPWLTFALREALYGLDCIARVLDPAAADDGLLAAMEALMMKDPGNWRKYYDGGPEELQLQRHFSFSDRIRYYWPYPEAQAAVNRLFAKLSDKPIPEPLISQYLGALYPEVVDGLVPARPREDDTITRAAATRSSRACQPRRRCWCRTPTRLCALTKT
jgi:D-tagatose-1,6-bisphosphate aldolase subunit GatZ/KbaZ